MIAAGRLLKIAEAFAAAKVTPSRSLLFVWHTGEELVVVEPFRKEPVGHAQEVHLARAERVLRLDAHALLGGDHARHDVGHAVDAHRDAARARRLDPHGDRLLRARAVRVEQEARAFERPCYEDAAAFGRDALWAFKATREGNTVVLAQRTPVRPTRAVLLARADMIQREWGLPGGKWVRVFKPVYP